MCMDKKVDVGAAADAAVFDPINRSKKQQGQ